MTKESAIDNDLGNTGSADVNMNVTYENIKDLNNKVRSWSVGSETEYVEFIVCEGSSIPNEQQTTHYAEIHTRKPAESLARKTPTKSPDKSAKSPAKSTECEGSSIPNEQQTTHYAKIHTRKPAESLARKTPTKSPDKSAKSPAKSAKSPAKSTESLPRKTRESDNPILRGSHDNDKSDDSKDNCRPRFTQDDSALYENTRTAKHVLSCGRENSRNGHEELQCSRSDSELVVQQQPQQNIDPEIVCQHTSDVFNTYHVYENFEDRMKSRMSIKSTTSNETSETESLYEDLDIVYEEMSPPSQQRPVSKPIDIVYTSIDFGRRTNSSPVSVGSCSNSSSLGSLERPELRRSTSYSCGNVPLAVGKPPELPQRGSGSFTKRSRPRSLHMGNPEGTQNTDFGLGLYTGTLVGSCIITKTSPKSIQKVIGDYLAREKKEQSKPVSFQVTSEFLCLSYNCAPWWLLAKNSVDDIGCITTYSANNKTALGYTISKPGDDTRLFVIHCSDADQIKEAIVKIFKRPATTNSLSRWSSMGVLSIPRSGNSRSLPRMSTSRSKRRSELASFDELVYLGSHKVKKSFLVVNDNISSVLDHTDSKEYTIAKIELYRDAIHLKDSKQDRLLDIHQLEWILSMGLFDEDRRYFGYISYKAFQGSKTRTACHVFRCDRVGLASQIMETIRQSCQDTYLARTSDYPPNFRTRTNSSTSTSSEGSMSSNSETMSQSSTSSSPADVDRCQTLPARMRKRPGRFLPKRLSRNRMSTIQSFTEENDTGIDTLGEETASETGETEEKPQTTQSVPDKVPRPPERPNQPPEVPKVPEEKPHSEKCTSEEKPQPAKYAPDEKRQPEIPKESSEKRFNVFYLVSTIVSPPLKPKHVKECLKQYQKSVDKAMKKSADNGQHYKKAQLVLSPRGVMIMDEQTHTPQAYYERAAISGVQSHPDGKCAFAFTTVVSGNTKHKCHLFLQDTDPIGAIIKETQTYIL